MKIITQIVTGSAKSKHISTIQIFQHKALKYIGWIITYLEKKIVISLHALFLEKEEANG